MNHFLDKKVFTDFLFLLYAFFISNWITLELLTGPWIFSLKVGYPIHFQPVSQKNCYGVLLKFFFFFISVTCRLIIEWLYFSIWTSVVCLFSIRQAGFNLRCLSVGTIWAWVALLKANFEPQPLATESLIKKRLAIWFGVI